MGLMDRLGLPWCLLDPLLLAAVVWLRTGPGRQGPLQSYWCGFPTKIDLEPEGRVYVIIDLSGSSGEGNM
ncbi:hypothetical protein DUI87_10009 [Hirundo rustica rustica]|uniref:Uncharacterized protein n=1 Tax=Hirundo rustica rustica TaxID=333673 RepID=A0A3M0KIM5_HIRRU|nr:hypothetical protein DUI87_10009 [Hirundo rustica rustica]